MHSINVIIDSPSFDMNSRIEFSYHIELDDFTTVKIIGIDSEGRRINDGVLREVVLIDRDIDNTSFRYTTTS